MNSSRKNGAKAFVYALVAFTGIANAVPTAIIEPHAQKRDLKDIRELRIGTYNLKNLFEKEGSIVAEGRQNRAFDLLVAPLANFKEEVLKPLTAVKEAANAVDDLDYDILVMEEVENIDAIDILDRKYLSNKYDTYLIEGNDVRGIDIGFYVKSDLPFVVEQRSHRFETWKDPTKDGAEGKLFSRDLPVLLFRTSEDSKPLFMMMGTHFKSKIDRPNDPESRILRKAQVERAALLTKVYEKEFGKTTPFFFAGDFNGEIHKEPEFKSLTSVAKLKDSFDIVTPPLSDTQRITHTYFPSTKEYIWSQLDAVVANQAAQDLVLEAEVYRYKDASGKPWPIPKTYGQMSQNPSDHFPIRVNVDFQKILDRN